MTQRKQLGQQGENLVAQSLENQGFTIVVRNYRKRCGEIDLIASKKELLVFVEVKTRRNPLFDPLEVITYSKQKKIIMTAKDFLARNDHSNKVWRFDVAIVTHTNNTPEISYIPDAFRDE